jgi:drug/metabolite transporter (DMT)-like permease
VATCFFGAPPDLAPATGPRILLLLLGIGLTATAGQLFLTKAFTLGEPAKVSIVGLTQIVFAMALDFLLGHLTFTPSTLAGMALVMAPTALVMAGKIGE